MRIRDFKEKTMNILNTKKAFYSLAAIGIMLFSVYGITNIIKAAGELPSDSVTDNTAIAAQTPGSYNPNGSLCPAGGCAACAGCSSVQYQQNVETLPSASAETGLY